MNKRGTVEISFGMIFSIILIIVFISVAVYGIYQILKIQDCTKAGLFKEDLQIKVDRMWNAAEGRDSFNHSLSSKFNYVCFVDFNKEKSGIFENFYDEIISYRYEKSNMIFWPLNQSCKDLGGFEIKHLNLNYITQDNNPNCFANKKGSINFGIEKDFSETLVRII